MFSRWCGGFEEMCWIHHAHLDQWDMSACHATKFAALWPCFPYTYLGMIFLLWLRWISSEGFVDPPHFHAPDWGEVVAVLSIEGNRANKKSSRTSVSKTQHSYAYTVPKKTQPLCSLNLSVDEMSHAMRKPVFAICDQQRCRSACAYA